MIVKGVRTDEPTYNEIKGVANLGRPWDEQLYPVYSDIYQCLMK